MHSRMPVLVLSLVALFQADVGWAREWRVERITGTAWTIESVEKRNALAVGMTVPEGLTIATAPSGRVRLSSENNVMTLGPSSVAVVKPKGTFSSKTEVLQRVGSIEFDVEKRASPHFTVQTPYMAAVVKGTAFTITVTKTDAKIGVDRGLVQVRDLKTGETAGVGAGQRASVSVSAPGLSTAGITAPEVTPSKPSAPSVAPVGQALSSFREAQATETSRSSSRSASRSDAASTTSDAGVSASRSASASGFGGYGGDSNGRDRSSIGRSTAETNAGEGDGSSTAGNSNSRQNGRSNSGPAENGKGHGNPGGNGNGNPGGNNGNGNPGGNNGNGNGNGNGGGDGDNDDDGDDGDDGDDD